MLLVSILLAIFLGQLGQSYSLYAGGYLLARVDAETGLEFQIAPESESKRENTLYIAEILGIVVEVRISPLVRVPDITVEGGSSASVQIVFDEPEDGLILELACNRGNFITLQGTTVVASPRETDLGQVSCQLKITDRFGLSSNTGFTVTVLPPNRPPILSTIPDQTVKAGSRRSLMLQAADPNDPTGAGLRFSMISGPVYATLSDNGGGKATLLLAPTVAEFQGGRVVLQVSEPEGLTAQSAFEVTIEPAVVILDVSRSSGKLILNGLGFGTAQAQVSINGQDVSGRITGQSDHSITLAGSLKRLNLRHGANQIQVRAGEAISSIFVFSL